MSLSNRLDERLWRVARLFAVCGLIFLAEPRAADGVARQDAETNAPAIRVVHGVAGAGPLDVYVDGAIALIGIGFGDASGELGLAAGEHGFAVVASGAEPDAAIAEGQIALESGTRSYVALLGPADEASVGIYTIDERPIETGRARFRIISGVADAGEITPAFPGGDELSDPLGFGDASQYAAIDAGVYDLDMLDAATGGLLLALPQTPFAEGTATDLLLIGQVNDGTIQVLVNPTPLETEIEAGGEWTAGIFSGGCGPDGPPVAELGVIQVGQGQAVGVEETPRVAQGYGVGAVSFAALTASPHVVAVIDADPASGPSAPVACGEIGGPLTDTGALVIALQASDAEGADGVAVLSPALDNPETTGVSIFVPGVAQDDAADGIDGVSEEDAG